MAEVKLWNVYTQMRTIEGKRHLFGQTWAVSKRQAENNCRWRAKREDTTLAGFLEFYAELANEEDNKCRKLSK